MVLAGCGFSGSEGVPLDGGGSGVDAPMNGADAAPTADAQPQLRIDFLPTSEVLFSEANWTLTNDSELDTSLTTNPILPIGVTFLAGKQRDDSNIAVLRVNRLEIDEEATLRVIGDRPLFIIARDVIINGKLDAGARGNTPGPGGGNGGGPGTGQRSQEDNNGGIQGHSGGGGGSFRSTGGQGGTIGFATSGPGASYAIEGRLVGGAAGGRSGSCANSSGAGGGAVLIYAQSIRVNGSINAGGGGGGEGLKTLCGTGTAVRAGGGGGSGGTIWLQADSLSGNGNLAANGGGGGASTRNVVPSDGVAGQDGQPSTTVALGGSRAASSDASNGGSGAALGIRATAGGNIGVSGSTGGGGGGGGAIVYRSPSGLGALIASPTATPAPSISP